MDYEQMLKRGRDALPEETTKGNRFEIQKVKGHIQGKKTIISNISQIAQSMQRKQGILIKYIEKQMASKGQLAGNFVVFNTKLSAKLMNERIQQFADEFVICKECGKPDTQLSKNTGVYVIKCQACGAKYTVKSRF